MKEREQLTPVKEIVKESYKAINKAIWDQVDRFEPKVAYTFRYNPAYDCEKKQYMHFKTWWDAVGYAQAYKMSLKMFSVVKVEDHYEIH